MIFSQQIPLNEDNEIFLQPSKFSLNLFHTFPNINILSWIYFFAGHSVQLILNHFEISDLAEECLHEANIYSIKRKRLKITYKHF